MTSPGSEIRNITDNTNLQEDVFSLCDNLFINLLKGNYFAASGAQENALKVTLSDKLSYEISKSVLERLLLRHAILRRMEKIESGYEASENFYVNLFTGQEIADPTDNSAPNTPLNKPKVSGENNLLFKICVTKSGGKIEKSVIESDSKADIIADSSKKAILSERKVRSYRLAVTDLFVEKAIAYLEVDYGKYIRTGHTLFSLGFTVLTMGIILSFVLAFPTLSEGLFNKMGVTNFILPFSGMKVSGDSWLEFASSFVKTFTLFGFLIIFTVYCWRLGKAMMDQAERLRERRHSLRQGRLFIHLNNGIVSAADLEKAFDWNVSKGNAFANIPTEASAPWGSVIKEALKTLPEIFKRNKSPT